MGPNKLMAFLHCTDSKKPRIAVLGFFVSTLIKRIRMKNLINYSPKNQTKVDGKMSEQGADKVGNKLANAVIIFVVLIGSAALIAASRWW